MITRSRRTFLKHAAAAFAAGVAPTCFMAADAWGQTTVELPDTYALPGDTISSRLNLMLASSPLGSKNFFPAAYGVLTPTPGQDYYIKYNQNRQIVSNTTPYRPLEFANSNGLADVLVFEPTPPTYADLLGGQNGLCLTPQGVQMGAWSPIDPKCSWARNVFRYKFNTGHGAGKFKVTRCYGSFGLEYGFLCEGLAGQASMYSSTFEDNWCNGGMKFVNFGDNVRVIHNILSGKMGIDFQVMPGAAQFLIQDNSGRPLGGPAIRGRAGNKVTILRNQFEQGGWNSDLFGTVKRVVDLQNESQPSGTKMNGLNIDDLTVANQSGVSMNHLLYIDNTILTRQGQVNCYGTNPVTTCIEYGSGCEFPMIAQPPTYDGTFTNKLIVPGTSKPYGFRLPPAWWNTPFQVAFNTTGGGHAFFIKGMDGKVLFFGEWQSIPQGGLPSIETVCGVPPGLGSLADAVASISQGFGLPDAKLRVSPATSSNAGVISIEGIHPSATFFRGSIEYLNKEHADGIITNN